MLFLFLLDELIVRKFVVQDCKKIKRSICAICIQWTLAGRVERAITRVPDWVCGDCGWKNVKGDSGFCQNPNKYCGAQVEVNKSDIETEIRLTMEGKRSDVEGAIRDINKLLEGKGVTMTKIKASQIPQYTSFLFVPTSKTILRDDSSGGDGKIDAYSVGSDSSKTSYFELRSILDIRDQFCRLHGADCLFIELGNAETWKVGHISAVRKEDEQISVIKKNHLTNDARNAYKWCNEAEWSWRKLLWMIDPLTGNAVFAPEFPFDDLKINPKKTYKVGFWNDKSNENMNEMDEMDEKMKEKRENDFEKEKFGLGNEPSQAVIEERRIKYM